MRHSWGGAITQRWPWRPSEWLDVPGGSGNSGGRGWSHRTRRRGRRKDSGQRDDLNKGKEEGLRAGDKLMGLEATGKESH